MNVFTVNYIITCLLGWFLLYRKSENKTEERLQKNKKILVIVACFMWILIAGLRGDSVGSDTTNYSNMFELASNMSWDDIWRAIKDYYSNGMASETIEPVFLVFEKLVSLVSDSRVFYKFVVATIFMTSFGNYVYKYSKDPCLSFMLYDALFFNMFSLTGYRQVISVSITILYGYRFIRNRQLLSFLIVLFLGFLFHKSTLIMLPFYFVCNKKITTKYVLTVILVVGVMIIYRKEIFETVKVFVGYDEYSGGYGFKQSNFMFFLSMFCLITIWKFKLLIKMDSYSTQYINAIILSWLMFPFAMESPTSMRLVYDFAFVLLILFPLIAESFLELKEHLIVYMVVIALLGYFVINRTPEYKFFWQDKEVHFIYKH